MTAFGGKTARATVLGTVKDRRPRLGRCAVPAASLTAPARRAPPGGVGTKSVPTIDHAAGGSNKGLAGKIRER